MNVSRKLPSFLDKQTTRGVTVRDEIAELEMNYAPPNMPRAHNIDPPQPKRDTGTWVDWNGEEMYVRCTLKTAEEAEKLIAFLTAASRFLPTPEKPEVHSDDG